MLLIMCKAVSGAWVKHDEGCSVPGLFPTCFTIQCGQAWLVVGVFDLLNDFHFSLILY